MPGVCGVLMSSSPACTTRTPSYFHFTLAVFAQPHAEGHVGRQLLAPRAGGLGRLRRPRALFGTAGTVGDAEDLERRDDRRFLEKAAVRLGGHARHGADLLAADQDRVAQHMRRARDRARDDLVLAHHETPLLD